MKHLVCSTVVSLVLYSSNLAMAAAPALPPGLGPLPPAPANNTHSNKSASPNSHSFSGYWDVRSGVRTEKDANQRNTSLFESRLQLALDSEWNTGEHFIQTHISADLLYDDIDTRDDLKLETGEGWLDLREANAVFRPSAWSDVKLGRQILTWGTGDLLFLNDLFAKDWNAFFIGRDTEYLKAPSDALKVSLFHRIANLDVVYLPRFDSDRFIDGRRISYFNNTVNSVVGRNLPIDVDKPDQWLSDAELALRLYRNIASFEVALYGYDGFWKSPNGQNPLTGEFTFPSLRVIGASARGTMGAGIANLEWAYYHSRDDSNGSDPFVRNSEQRVLLGYEQQLRAQLTGAVQFYIEHRTHQTAYRQALPNGAIVADQNRQLLTLRLTQLLMNQNLNLSLFNFYSPTDKDGYSRVSANFKVTDRWQIGGGINHFYGAELQTFFGQFESTSNIYASIRYLL